MRDHAELIEALRFAFEEQDCGECALAGTDRCTVGQTCRFKDAADAIEELLEWKRLLESKNNLQAKIIKHMETVMKVNGLPTPPKEET